MISFVGLSFAAATVLRGISPLSSLGVGSAASIDTLLCSSCGMGSAHSSTYSSG